MKNDDIAKRLGIPPIELTHRCSRANGALVWCLRQILIDDEAVISTHEMMFVVKTLRFMCSPAANGNRMITKLFINGCISFNYPNINSLIKSHIKNCPQYRRGELDD